MLKLHLDNVDWVVRDRVRIEAFPVDSDPTKVDLYIFPDET
jgi:hypothetical protein